MAEEGGSAIVIVFHGVAGGLLPPEVAGDPGARRYIVTEPFLAEALRLIPVGQCATAAELSSRQDGAWVTITFDDGLATDARVAFPLLAAAGLKGTFFVSAGKVGSPGYVTWEDLAVMSRGGMEIGSHGLCHRHLVALPRAEAASEIRRSKEAIEDRLGAAVVSFAPPGGHYRPWMLGEAAAAGYRVFAGMVPGRTKLAGNPLLLRRNHVLGHHRLDRVAAVVAGRPVVLLADRVAHLGLELPKRLLGLGAYDRLRGMLLGLKRGAAGGRGSV